MTVKAFSLSFIDAGISLLASIESTPTPADEMGDYRINWSSIGDIFVAYSGSTRFTIISRDSTAGKSNTHFLHILVVDTYAPADAGFLHPALSFVGC